MYLRFSCIVLFFILAGCGSTDTSRLTGNDSIKKSCVAVNGKFIPQQELDDLVLRAYGRKVLDDMVLLEVARQYAADRGVVLSDEMYQAELHRFLNEIAPGKREADQLAIFAFVLKKRGLTQELFDLVLKKQALLRKCIDEEISVSEDMLKAEYERLYGQKRSVMLLATSSVRSMERAESELNGGKSFSQIVMQYSEDETSLRDGGIIAGISKEDTYLPSELRSKVFDLAKAGDISDSFLVFDDGRQYWYKIRLEEIVPAMEAEYDKSELTEIIKRKETNRRILELQDKLMDQAKVIIIDQRVK